MESDFVENLAGSFEIPQALEEFESTTGATETAFEKMLGGFNTQMAILKNNFQTVFIAIGNVIIENIQPMIESLNTEFKKLNEIGFENLASALKDQLPLILDSLSKAFQFAMIDIENRIDLLGLKFQDLITPFTDMSEIINAKQLENEEFTRLSVDTMGLMFTNMYNGVIGKAKELKTEQDKANKALTEQNKAVEDSELKFGVLGKQLKKFFRLKRTGIDLDIQTVQAKQSELFLEQKLSAEKAKQLQNEVKGAVLSGQTANQAMRSVVKAKIMESVVGLVASIFKTMPYPLNLVLAAGAGAAAGGIIDKQLGDFGGGLKFADGGIVPGIGNQDTVPAMLTPGELILNQAQQENLAGSGGVTINIGGNLIGEESFVRDTLIPEIEKAQVLA